MANLVCQCDAEEHDEMYECAVCGKCCFGNLMYKESHQTYEEKATCLDCALKEDEKFTRSICPQCSKNDINPDWELVCNSCSEKNYENKTMEKYG